MDLFRRKSNAGIIGGSSASANNGGGSHGSGAGGGDELRKGGGPAIKANGFSSHYGDSSRASIEGSPRKSGTPPRKSSVPDLEVLPPLNMSPFSFPANPGGPSPPRSSPSHSTSPSPAHHTHRSSSLSVKRSRQNMLSTSLHPPAASARGLALAASTASQPTDGSAGSPSASVLRKASSVDSMAHGGLQPSLSSPRADGLVGSPRSSGSSSTEGTATRFFSAVNTPRVDDHESGPSERVQVSQLSPDQSERDTLTFRSRSSPSSSNHPAASSSMQGLGLGLGSLSSSRSPSNPVYSIGRHPSNPRPGNQLPRLRSSRIGRYVSRAGDAGPTQRAESDVEYESDLDRSESEVGGAVGPEDEPEDERVEVIWQRSPKIRDAETSESSDEEDDHDEVGEEEWIEDPRTVSHPPDPPRRRLHQHSSEPPSRRTSISGRTASSSALSEVSSRLAQSEAEIMASARRKLGITEGSTAHYSNASSSSDPATRRAPVAPPLGRTQSFPTNQVPMNGLEPPHISSRLTRDQSDGGALSPAGTTSTASASTVRPRAASASSSSWLGGTSSRLPPQAEDGSVPVRRVGRRSTLPGTESSSGPWPPISILVIGRKGCGKTRIVREAFKRYGNPLSNPQPVETFSGEPPVEVRWSRVSTKKRDGQEVYVYEANLSHFQVSNGQVIWPQGLPRADAIALCYDVGDLASWEGIADLYAARDPKVPHCVFGCKSGGVPRPMVVPPKTVVKAVGKLILVSTEEEKTNQKMHQGFCWMMNTLIDDLDNTSIPSASPQPTAHPYNFPEAARPRQNRPHGLQLDTVLSRMDGPSTSTSSLISSIHGSEPYINQGLFHPNSFSPGSTHNGLPLQPRNGGPDGAEQGHSRGLGSVSSMASSNANDQERTSTLGSINLDSQSDLVAALGLKRKEGQSGAYLTLQELVQLLFYNTVRGQDHLFSQTFFACYRRFACPREIISLFVSEFLLLEGKKLAGVYAQLKICGLLGYWLDHYPNDFAAPRTQEILREMMNLIASKVALAHHAARLLPFHRRMDKLKDDILAWVKSDYDGGPAVHSTIDLLSTGGTSNSTDPTQMGVFVHMTQTSTVSYVSNGSNTSLPELSTAPVVKKSVDLSVRRPSHSRTGSIVSVRGGPSDTDISSRANTSSDGLPSSSSHAQSIESPMSKTPSRGSGTGSSSFQPSASVVLDVWESKAMHKVVQKFIESSDQQIANDITRLDWKYFEQIHPRSLLTHCYSGGSEEGGDAVLRQFSTHFNDLSSLFCILVLSQSKLRARVRVYERILNIIDLLRTQNNYMALSSITASVSQLCVERLHETIELAMDLKTNRNKINRFQSHLKLVDGRSSYKTYKMSIKEDERSGKRGVLLIPSIMKELVQIRELFKRQKAVHQKQTDDGEELINWREYERYGDIFAAVTGCQSRGPPVQLSTAPNVVAQMLRDRPEIGEKILGDRSLFLEPPDGTSNALSTALRRIGIKHT